MFTEAERLGSSLLRLLAQATDHRGNLENVHLKYTYYAHSAAVHHDSQIQVKHTLTTLTLICNKRYYAYWRPLWCCHPAAIAFLKLTSNLGASKHEAFSSWALPVRPVAHRFPETGTGSKTLHLQVHVEWLVVAYMASRTGSSKYKG